MAERRWQMPVKAGKREMILLRATTMRFDTLHTRTNKRPPDNNTDLWKLSFLPACVGMHHQINKHCCQVMCQVLSACCRLSARAHVHMHTHGHTQGRNKASLSNPKCQKLVVHTERSANDHGAHTQSLRRLVKTVNWCFVSCG